MNNRTEYLFSYELKRQALESAFYQCENCGKHDSRTNKLEAHHLLSVWFARECKIEPALIKKLDRIAMLCHSCHAKVHKQESRHQYEQIAWFVFGIDTSPDHKKDEWRSDPNHSSNRKLKQ